MAWLSEDERRARVTDSTRDRTILLNQTLLAGVALIGILFSLGLGQVRHPTPFLVGSILIYVAAAAAVLVPWRRLPFAVAGILPAVDIVAVGFLRDAAPDSGLGLLWAFPAMWIGAIFGIVGVIGSTLAVGLILWFIIETDPALSLSASTILLPLTVAALATMAHLSARRASAQRGLLEKQSRHLQRSVDRARRQEDLVTEVLDAVDFGVIRVTPEGEFVVTNEAHGRLQGASEDSGDLSVFAADGTTPIPAEAQPLRRARRGETFENELTWYGAPGAGRRALTVTARSLFEIDGSPAGSVVVSRDVTAEELALRAREDLVASVSHELRTPLTSIIGYLDLVLDAPALPEDARRDLRVVERNASRLLELVTDILAMSTLSRLGVDLALRREPTDLSAIVAASVEAVAPRAAERSIRIDTSGVGAADARVDEHRIRQVVDNLLSNAVKYGRHAGRVEVTVSRSDTDAYIRVSDDGPGISDAEQPQLFERFFRSDAVRNSATHGSGLGLAISRDIVRAHGGDITAESELGSGASFLVRLPVSRVDDEETT